MNETIRVALAGLAANKLRSGLTILGLMIGVGSVIVLVAVGTGSSTAVRSRSTRSDRTCCWSSRRPRSAGCSAARRRIAAAADAGRRERACRTGSRRPTCRASSPVVNANGVTLTYGEHHVLAVVVRRDDADLRGRARLHDGRGVVVHERRGASSMPACWWSGRRWSASCSAGQDPVGDDGPGQRHELRGDRRHGLRRAPTAPRTRTTSRSHR